MEAIVDRLPKAARRERKPTAEQLAKTYPPGRRPAASETERETPRHSGPE
jgi:hypothetical protein